LAEKNMNKFFSSVCDVDEESVKELKKHLTIENQIVDSEKTLKQFKSLSETSIHQKHTKFIKNVSYGQYLFSNFSCVGKKLILKIDHLSNRGLQVMDLNTFQISESLVFEEEIKGINKIRISKDEKYIFVFGVQLCNLIEMKDVEEYLKFGKFIQHSPLGLNDLIYYVKMDTLTLGNPMENSTPMNHTLSIDYLNIWRTKLNIQSNISRGVQSSDGNCICMVVDQLILIIAIPLNKVIASIEFRTIDILDLALFNNCLYLITYNDIEKFQLRIPKFELDVRMKNLENYFDLKFKFK
jgi:hypothetical protein